MNPYSEIRQKQVDLAKGFIYFLFTYRVLFFSNSSNRRLVTGPIAPSSAVISVNELIRIKVRF
jgi:hypothetical protein